MLALENKYRKTHELWLVPKTVLNIFEAKRLTFPEPHKPVTTKKYAFGSGLTKTFFLWRQHTYQREATR